MSRFDVATLPSRDDPFPLVVVESMLLGKPVVAFDVGSVRDQVGEGGTLVPPGDVDAFAAAVLHLLTDESARTALGRAARARAERLFSSTAFAHRLREILDVTTGSAGQAPRMASRQTR
jgi:glycosyltransferase involved in cell wall biosynthesis